MNGIDALALLHLLGALHSEVVQGRVLAVGYTVTALGTKLDVRASVLDQAHSFQLCNLHTRRAPDLQAELLLRTKDLRQLMEVLRAAWQLENVQVFVVEHALVVRAGADQNPSLRATFPLFACFWGPK